MGIKIAFICTGNSARSQIAEGFGKYYAKKFGKDIEVFSGGSKPVGYVHPLAIKVMAERKIDISNNKSKSLNEIPLNEVDYLITLCSEAEKDCPVIPNVKVEHWRILDPAGINGSEEEKLKIFRKVRDLIDTKVKALIGRL